MKKRNLIELQKLVKTLNSKTSYERSYKMTFNRFDFNSYSVVIEFSKIVCSTDLEKLLEFTNKNNCGMFLGVGYINIQ